MADPVQETKRRLDIAYDVMDRYGSSVQGALIAGSVAYGNNTYVRPDSDLDMVFFAEDIKGLLPVMFEGLDVEREALRNRYFDGYCFKQSVDDVEVSIHALSNDALDVICKAFIANLRLYRNEKKKDEVYVLHGFEGQEFYYNIKTIDLPDLAGVRTVVPISFLDSKQIQETGQGHDRFYIGVHRDKLLAAPRILIDDGGKLESSIDHLWSKVAGILHDESMRVQGRVDLSSMSILNAMQNRHKYNPEVIAHIENRTLEQLRKVTG